MNQGKFVNATLLPTIIPKIFYNMNFRAHFFFKEHVHRQKNQARIIGLEKRWGGMGDLPQLFPFFVIYRQKIIKSLSPTPFGSR